MTIASVSPRFSCFSDKGPVTNKNITVMYANTLTQAYFARPFSAYAQIRPVSRFGLFLEDLMKILNNPSQYVRITILS